jgi:hypothetical protein
LEIQVLACDRHKNVAGLNQLIGSQPTPLENWIFNDKTDKTNDKKHAQIPFHLIRPHTIKMNDSIRMDSTIT